MVALRWCGRAGVIAALLLFPLTSVPAAGQQSATAARAKAHHHHDPKFATCQKRANAQKLHFEARRTFMRNCLGG
jgi:hypothetical protein